MTRQNTSHAVMAQRASAADEERPPHPLHDELEAAGLSRDDIDDFPTPPWGARALVEHVLGVQELAGRTVWEPAANRGFLMRGLEGYGAKIFGSDIFDYRVGLPVFDFTLMNGGLFGDLPTWLDRPVDWVITNAPFSEAGAFVRAALKVARRGVAILLRTQILEGAERFREIYEPLADRWTFAQFVERIPMAEAQCSPDLSSATAYGWLVIWQEPKPAEFLLARRHIRPCRAHLERSGDYVMANQKFFVKRIETIPLQPQPPLAYWVGDAENLRFPVAHFVEKKHATRLPRAKADELVAFLTEVSVHVRDFINYQVEAAP